MAKNKEKLKRIKRQQKEAYLRRRESARNRAVQTLSYLQNKEQDYISQGFTRGYNTSLPDISKMSAQEADYYAKTKYAQLSKMKSDLYFTINPMGGIQGQEVLSGMQYQIKDIPLSKINVKQGRGIEYYLAKYVNKGAEGIMQRMSDKTKNATSITRAKDAMIAYDILKDYDLIINPQRSAGRQFEQTIDIKEIMKLTKQGNLDPEVRAALEVLAGIPDMSEEQQQIYQESVNRLSAKVSQQVGTYVSPETLKSIHRLMEVTGLWDWVGKVPDDSDRPATAYAIQDFIRDNEDSWSDSVFNEIQQALNDEYIDFDRLARLLRARGMRYVSPHGIYRI